MIKKLEFLLPKKGAVILGCILIFFLGLIFFLTKGNPVFPPLQTFAKVEKEVSFRDENGNLITRKDLEGKILLVNYLSTTCPLNFPEGCPISFGVFKFFIYEQLVDNIGFKDVRVVSVFLDSSDSETFSKKIKEFRSYHKLDSDKWIFVKGNENPFFDVNLSQGNPWNKKDTIYGYDKEAYIMTLMIDKEFNVRGKYMTTLAPEIRRITKEISLLIREENEN